MTLYEIVQNLPDEKQRAAIKDYERCVMIAGPGSGKTYRLVLKVAYLLGQEVTSMQKIACVTYMNDAVREIEDRLSKYGFEDENRLFVGTVHKFCITSIILPFKSIFLPDWPDYLRIADQDMQYDLLVQALEALEMYVPVNESKRRKMLRDTLQSMKANRITQLLNPRYIIREDEMKILNQYLYFLRQDGYVDFDDIAIEACRLVIEQPQVRNYIVAQYPWLVIDEYQDLGKVFNALVFHLVKHSDIKFFVVGDANQSIMGFQGAEPTYLERLAELNGVEKVPIRITRRCLPHIIDAANMLLPSSENKIETIHPPDQDRKLNYKFCPNGLDEQIVFICNEAQRLHNNKNIPYGDIAVLCRNTYTITQIAKAFSQVGVPYSGKEDGRYPRVPLTRWLEDISSWMREGWQTGSPRFHNVYRQYRKLIHLQDNRTRRKETDLAIQSRFFQALWHQTDLNVPVWQWLTTLIDILQLDKIVEDVEPLEPYNAKGFWEFSELTQPGGKLESLTVADLALCGRSDKSVFLSTLHSSKGLEFDAVIIPELEQGRLPDYRNTSEEKVAEERRLLYVGITRAKREITLLSSGFYILPWGKKSPDGHSQFLEELGLFASH